MFDLHMLVGSRWVWIGRQASHDEAMRIAHRLFWDGLTVTIGGV